MQRVLKTCRGEGVKSAPDKHGQIYIRQGRKEIINRAGAAVTGWGHSKREHSERREEAKAFVKLWMSLVLNRLHLMLLPSQIIEKKKNIQTALNIWRALLRPWCLLSRCGAFQLKKCVLLLLHVKQMFVCLCETGLWKRDYVCLSKTFSLIQ